MRKDTLIDTLSYYKAEFIEENLNTINQSSNVAITFEFESISDKTLNTHGKLNIN